MRSLLAAIVSLICLSTSVAQSQQALPAAGANGDALKLVQTIELPGTINGNFDHFGIDLKRHLLFATPEDYKAVLIIDLATARVVRHIDGIARPHAILYRPDSDRLYVTDGGDGSLKIYDGETYRQIDRIALLKDADSIGYDIARKYLYIDNGGGDVGEQFSMLSVVDTESRKKLTDIKIDGDTLEAMTLDNYRPRLYVNNKAKNTVTVIDRLKNNIVASWPLTLGTANVAMALDEQHQRLFVGCRSGQILILDTNTGKELQALPIAKGVDDVIFDPASKRLYAATNGELDIFDQADADHYITRGSVPTGPNGRTARLSPELNRLFVAIPATGSQKARVMIYEPVDTPAAKSSVIEPKVPVDAPMAEQIVLETLSKHPDLRKMGLHAVPPGQEHMVIIANGNATRIGVQTTDRDFAAVKSGHTYCAKIDDGGFYNMKLPMTDAQGRAIGILVMEIPQSSATDETSAIRQAEAIREELSQKIPNLDRLFQR
jgi:DNA-binding beta-propeller fold protein YncE